MRHSLFSLGIILVLALIVTGCGGGEKKGDKPAPANNAASPDASKETATVRTSGKTSHPSQEVVMRFLTEILKDNTQGAMALFTPKARQEYAKTNSTLDPAQFKGMEFRITGSDVLSETDKNFFGVYVDMVAEGESIETVWGVRKIGEEYRVANLAMNYGGEFVTLDFEDPAGTRSTWSEGAAEQQALANQQQQNLPAGQQFAQPPQFNVQGFQQPNTQQPPQMAQPNTPNFQ